MITDKKEKFLINIVLVLFIVGITCCFTLFPLLSESVSAEELTNNSVLNFNQLFDISKIPSSNVVDSIYVNYDFTKGNFYYLQQDINVRAGHKYLVVGAQPGLCRLQFDSPHTIYFNEPNSIATAQYNDTAKFYAYSAGSGTYKSIIQIFDLTQIFGSGNEPISYEEFKSYFVSDYYAYSTSTLVPLDSTTSYSQGYIDGIQSFSLVTAADDIYNSSYYSGGEPTNTLVVNDTAPYFQKLVYQTQTDTPNVYLIFPMINTIPANSNFYINGYINSYVHDTSGTLNIYAFINNKDYISLGSISFNGSTPKEFNINVNVPFSVSNIAFISNNSLCVLGDVTITYKISNLQKLAQDNFNAGRDSVDIDSIKSQAFNKGKQAGIESANKYTFSALVSSVVDAPIKAITGLLNFEIFGVNLKSFMLSLFTIAVVIAIVKLFLGNVGGSSAK